MNSWAPYGKPKFLGSSGSMVVNHCCGCFRKQDYISTMVPVSDYLEFISNRVLSCLMENLHTDNMIPECEQQLLHLEFFIARDFKYEDKVAFLHPPVHLY